MNADQSLVSGRANHTRAVHEPPLRASLARRSTHRDARRCRAAGHPGRTGRGRFTNRPYGTSWNAVAYAGIHAGVAPRDIPDARVADGSRAAPTGRPGTPQHSPGMHAGGTRRAASWTHGSCAVHEPPLRASLHRLRGHCPHRPLRPPPRAVQSQPLPLLTLCIR